MKENWLIVHEGVSYPAVVEYKRMRSVRARIDEKSGNILISAPNNIPRKDLDRIIDSFMPRLVKRVPDRPAIEGDEIFLFGEKTVVEGFSALDEKKRKQYLSDKLKEYLSIHEPSIAAEMGVTTPYKLRVRDMSTRFGVNSQKTASLTFTLSLVHFAPSAIDSVVVHELAHDKYHNHGERFYALVYRYCPEYKRLRKCLIHKEYGYGRDQKQG